MWTNQYTTVTVKQLVPYLSEEVELQVNKIRPHVELEQERVEKADLNYPIIIVQQNNQPLYVLDGNHRLQKAINLKQKTIKARMLELNSIPSNWAVLFK